MKFKNPTHIDNGYIELHGLYGSRLNRGYGDWDYVGGGEVMEMVNFSNNGEIDPRVWSTFGVSVKESDNAIGQFGTGLKYAIAVLMREGRGLSINSCGKSYVFGVEQADIRGKEFAQVTCNGEPLPFTTHLGSKWELWQAYRELYSNCIDEGGRLHDEGETVISAELGDVRHADVFLEPSSRQLVASSDDCDVYFGKSSHIYYRGIRAQDLPTPSLYTYDIRSAELTEDRTLKYNFLVHSRIGDTALLATNPDFVRDFLTQSKGWYEENVSFEYCHSRPSETVLDLYSQFRKSGKYMQDGMTKKAIEQLGIPTYQPTAASEHQASVIEKASHFCSLIGHQIRYPVLVSTDLPNDTLAAADRRSQQIFLSERVLTQGVKQVASTLLVENLHLSEGFNDCTYDMQSYLFDQIVTMGERLTGEVL